VHAGIEFEVGQQLREAGLLAGDRCGSGHAADVEDDLVALFPRVDDVVDVAGLASNHRMSPGAPRRGITPKRDGSDESKVSL